MQTNKLLEIVLEYMKDIKADNANKSTCTAKSNKELKELQKQVKELAELVADIAKRLNALEQSHYECECGNNDFDEEDEWGDEDLYDDDDEDPSIQVLHKNSHVTYVNTLKFVNQYYIIGDGVKYKISYATINGNRVTLPQAWKAYKEGNYFEMILVED